MSGPSSAARPKRAAEDFAINPPSGSNKKPRFDARNPSTLAPDAPEEDLILDADVIGKSGRQTKRNAVNIDGYDSDSDNDNFDARAEEKKRLDGKNGVGGSKDEEDDDMFADLEEAVQGTASGDEVEAGKRKKKDVQFLDQAEIEGQVMGSKSGGHVPANLTVGGRRDKRRKDDEDSESSSSGEDEDRAEIEAENEDALEVGAGAKKKHAPRLDAFNLKDEEEEGRFDSAGNFVRKAVDPDAVNDVWLDGLSKKDMKRAREAQEKRESEQKEKDLAKDALLTSDLLSTLILHLEPGETALEALQRLNRSKSSTIGEKKTPKWKLKKQQQRNSMDVDQSTNDKTPTDPAENHRLHALNAITTAADALYSRQNDTVYDTEREMLLRQYKRDTGDDWVAPSAPAATGNDGDVEMHTAADGEWEYRWSDARDGGEHHGPYDGATMKAWVDAGYFGEGVEFRRVGMEGWSGVLDVK